MPIKYYKDDPDTKRILLKPILDYIKSIGCKIEEHEIFYVPEGDEHPTFVGIEGKIKDRYRIKTKEMTNLHDSL